MAGAAYCAKAAHMGISMTVTAGIKFQSGKFQIIAIFACFIIADLFMTG
jgi:hypothetical protein